MFSAGRALPILARSHSGKLFKFPIERIQRTEAAFGGKLLNVMRFAKYGYIIAYEADTQDHEKMIEFSQLIKFPANFSKFMIKQDKQSGNYYSVATRVYDDNKNARNLLSLMYS